MYPYYTIFWWVSLLSLTFVSIAFNESIYPSTYLFGGPDKVLMLTMDNMTSTDDMDYYFNCKCVGGQQVLKTTFTEDDQTAQQMTYDIRMLLFLSMAVILIKMGLEFGAVRFVVEYRKVELDILYVVLFGASLQCAVATALILAVQQDSDCSHPLECKNESVWARQTFSSWLMVFTPFLTVAYGICAFFNPLYDKDIRCHRDSCRCHDYTAVVTKPPEDTLYF
tara:strand:- start:282 stop:950 length:669 start_codon:yes stop_codon:yes gene_type:complete